MLKQVLLLGNSAYLAQLKEAVDQNKMTLNNIRNLQCALVPAAYRSEEEDFEDDSSSERRYKGPTKRLVMSMHPRKKD